MHSRAGQEKLVQLNLEAQKFDVLPPQILNPVRHAGRHREIRAAVFPGYLSIRLAPDRNSWRSVNCTIGVSRLLTANERPAPAPTGVVEAVLNCVDDLGYYYVKRDLVEGQRVSVVNGPFVRIIGGVLNMDDGGRSRVLLENMGGKVVILLERGSPGLAALRNFLSFALRVGTSFSPKVR